MTGLSSDVRPPPSGSVIELIGRRRRRLTVMGIALLVLGVGSILIARAIRPYPYPFNAAGGSGRSPTSAYWSLELGTEHGTGEILMFRGTQEEADAWLERKQRELFFWRGQPNQIFAYGGIALLGLAVIFLTSAIALRLPSAYRARLG